MNPTQLRWIYNKHCKDEHPAKYKTWTQVAKLVEWPPCTTAVFMWWNDSVIVGANYDDECRESLYHWRVKYSLNKIAKVRDLEPCAGIHATNPNYQAWREMYYEQGMRQVDIARTLGISPAFCSQMKRKHEMGAFEVDK